MPRVPTRRHPPPTDAAPRADDDDAHATRRATYDAAVARDFAGRPPPVAGRDRDDRPEPSHESHEADAARERLRVDAPPAPPPLASFSSEKRRQAATRADEAPRD